MNGFNAQAVATALNGEALRLAPGRKGGSVHPRMAAGEDTGHEGV